MQLFSVENIFFAHKNIKKTALKSSILMALRFSFCSPDYPKQPRIEISYYKCSSVYYSVADPHPLSHGSLLAVVHA